MHPVMTFRDWIHHYHVGPGHPHLQKMEHTLHDTRFWALLAGGILLAFFVWLIAWGLGSGSASYAPEFYGTPYMF
jgi:hypothetical protein